MKITSLSSLAWLSLTICLLARADDTSITDKVKGWFSTKPRQTNTSTSSNGPSEKPKGKCLNVVMFGWEILQRLDAGVYEVQTVHPTPFCDLQYGVKSNCVEISGKTALLFTLDDKFSSAGRIASPLWIDFQENEKPETTEIALQNGFKKKVAVIRESAACTVYGDKLAKEEKQRERQQEVRNRAIAAEEQKKLDADEKRERAQAKKDHEEREKAEALWK